MAKRNGAMTILVAEDDPDDRLLIEDAFEESGCPNDIEFVEDGEELLHYLHREDGWTDLKGKPLPALILLDLNMPRLDGRAALKHIKDDQELRVIPIVVLTTSKSEEDIEATYKAGVNSFFSKPRDFDELVELAKILNQYWTTKVHLPSACKTKE